MEENRPFLRDEQEGNEERAVARKRLFIAVLIMFILAVLTMGYVIVYRSVTKKEKINVLLKDGDSSCGIETPKEKEGVAVIVDLSRIKLERGLSLMEGLRATDRHFKSLFE
ncbi:MAG: uncharacterized protein A8A55_0877 [Amphiamblys sp. WSBS2006]|nr:MAG: uncharacterized protein A8A55_0877 [Amphiamblys sp. WSBS2006]